MSSWQRFWIRKDRALRLRAGHRKVRPCLESLEERVAPAIFNVTSLADSNTAGSGSLRAAITTSNTTAGPNEIDILTPGTYNLTLGPAGATDNTSGQLSVLNNDVTILNKSGGNVAINQTVGDRVFNVSPTAGAINLTITGVTIEGGNVTGLGGGILVGTTSTLTLNNAIVQNNAASGSDFGDGGGIESNNGKITLNSTIVRNNVAGDDGGAIAVGDKGASGSFTVNNSLITGNTAFTPGNDSDGGGLASEGTGDAVVSNSTVSNNRAGGDGGGIDNRFGNLTLTNSIVSGNAVISNSGDIGGGGIAQEKGSGKVTITNSLIANNSSANTTAGSGGGGFVTNQTGDVTITGSQFSGNTSAVDGGGLLDTGAAKLTISSSTFNNNIAGGNGGGLDLQTTVASSLVNVTISGNFATGNGGGVFKTNAGVVTLTSDTVAFNSANNGGGARSEGASLTLVNTIVAKNSAVTANPDVDNNATGANLVDSANNFIGNNTGATTSFTAGTPNGNGSFVGTGGGPLDPLLVPLGDNGSTVTFLDGSHLLTHQDLANSGTNGVRDRGTTVGAPSVDERGFPRPDGGDTPSVPDIGAFEFQDVTLSVAVTAPPTVALGTTTLSVTVTDTSGNALPDDNSTVNVALPAGLAATGPLTFRIGPLAPGASQTISVPVLATAPGPQTVTAVLTSPDATPASASGTTTVAVIPAATTTTIIPPAATTITITGISDTYTLLKQRETVTARVTSGGVPVTSGVVTFTDNGQTQTASVGSDGTASTTFTFNLLQGQENPNAHGVSATFNSTAAFAMSTTSATASSTSLQFFFQLFLDYEILHSLGLV
jgi:hypothetical protein